MPSTTYRREPRTGAAGEILIEVGPDGKVVRGQLIDASPHGFAVWHEYEHFVIGQEVRVVYNWGKVPAWLAWVGRREGGMAAGFRTD
jgi:hypothetical protein